MWHSGTLKRKVFLGEVLVPLDGWRFEDKDSQRFNWYPLCQKVKLVHMSSSDVIQMRRNALMVLLTSIEPFLNMGLHNNWLCYIFRLYFLYLIVLI